MNASEWQARLADFVALLLRQPDFTIRIEAHSARLWQGQAPQAFVTDCALIARDSQLQRGLIYGCRRRDVLRLEFSRHVPEFSHQRFRNAWMVHKTR